MTEPFFPIARQTPLADRQNPRPQREDRFGFEQEITIKIARGGWRVCEAPISYYGRTYAEGKKITWKDGIRALWCLLRYGVFSSSS